MPKPAVSPLPCWPAKTPTATPAISARFMRAVFRDGLLPALRRDVVVLRAFFRSLNLLTAPDAMVKDPDVGARVLTVWQDRDNRPPEPALGPEAARRPAGPTRVSR